MADQAFEYGQANALIEGFNPDFVLADKGYDSNDFIENIKAIGAKLFVDASPCFGIDLA